MGLFNQQDKSIFAHVCVILWHKIGLMQKFNLTGSLEISGLNMQTYARFNVVLSNEHDFYLTFSKYFMWDFSPNRMWYYFALNEILINITTLVQSTHAFVYLENNCIKKPFIHVSHFKKFKLTNK